MSEPAKRLPLGMRTIALFEAAKGILALATAAEAGRGAEDSARLPGPKKRPPLPALRRTFCALNAAHSA